MTAISVGVGLVAASFFLSTSASWQFAGALLFLLHSILDGCDGEIARLTRRFGKHGALIDSLVDDLSRYAYSELHRNERAATVAAFVERGLTHFAELGIEPKRLMSDNAWT